ncbi:hypothetical protein DIPPA_03673 [Diplonema papillatum]|nr:hypothetical protein DIPPA_34099 [Diplonema papillatum]KAJ9447166.1 hypothetical protein DIPPA_03673 [Diplonema papillatum]
MAEPCSDKTLAALLQALQYQDSLVEEIYLQKVRWYEHAYRLLTEFVQKVAVLKSALDKTSPSEFTGQERQKPRGSPVGAAGEPGPARPLPMPAPMGLASGTAHGTVDEDSVPAQPMRPFAERLAHVVRTGSKAEVAAFLSNVRLHQWETIGPLGFEAVLPFLVDWMSSGTGDEPAKAFQMMYEGFKRWGTSVVNLPHLSTTVQQLRACLSRHVAHPEMLSQLTEDVASVLKYIEDVQ